MLFLSFTKYNWYTKWSRLNLIKLHVPWSKKLYFYTLLNTQHIPKCLGLENSDSRSDLIGESKITIGQTMPWVSPTWKCLKALMGHLESQLIESSLLFLLFVLLLLLKPYISNYIHYRLKRGFHKEIQRLMQLACNQKWLSLVHIPVWAFLCSLLIN